MQAPSKMKHRMVHMQATRAVASKVSSMARSLITHVLLIHFQRVGSMSSVIIQVVGNERCHASMVMFDYEGRLTGDEGQKRTWGGPCTTPRWFLGAKP